MTFQLIEQERAHHAVSLLCSVLGVTRQGFYAWRKRPPSARTRRDQVLKWWLRRAFADSRDTYGAPRLRLALRRDHGIAIGQKRVARLMRELGIEGVSRGRRRIRTTIPDRRDRPAPDRVDRNFTAHAPNQLWLADITYVRCDQGWLYLAVVMDIYSRKIVGWSMSDSLEADLVADALAMAVARRQPEPGLIHHSDQGSQYTSVLLGRTLRELGILASMGSVGDPYDNAPCESVIGTIKAELVDRHRFESRDIARLRVFDYIEAFYNRLRIHSALGGLSPEQYEQHYHHQAALAVAT